MTTFGISTYLVHDERLAREHLAAVAAQGFTSIELFALRSHFDYHDRRAAEQMGAWVRELGLTLHSVHAPLAEGFQDGVWGSSLSNGAADERRRARAVAEATRALELADHVPFRFLVVHLGVPDAVAAAADNAPAAVGRSLKELHAAAASRGVRLALEVIPNRLSQVEVLAARLDEEPELADAGICFDFGHAFLMGDLVDAIEGASGHLITTHVHDNQGRSDEHLTPFDGRIDWAAAGIALQKIGYEDVMMLELPSHGDVEGTLTRARRACDRLDPLLTPSDDWLAPASGVE